MDEIEERGDLLPNSDLPKAITYIRKEWNALVDIFIYGNTQIGKNGADCYSKNGHAVTVLMRQS